MKLHVAAAVLAAGLAGCSACADDNLALDYADPPSYKLAPARAPAAPPPEDPARPIHQNKTQSQ